MYKQSKSYEETIKDKTFLNVNVLSNDFLNKTQKDLFFKVYSKSIKYLKSLNYFVRKLKQNKALQYEVDCDLFLNSFSSMRSNIITNIYIKKTNTFYKFRISDLISVINNALTHSSPEIYIEPYFPRNPYTNCEFTKSELYHIYFVIKESSFLMPQLFHNFFLLHFDLTQYSIMNDDVLREIAVTNYLKNMSDSELLYEFEHMTDLVGQYMPRIPNNFNRLTAAKKLKPQIEFFCRYSFTNSQVKKFHYYNIVKKQLLEIRKKQPFIKKKSFTSRRVSNSNSILGENQQQQQQHEDETVEPYYPIDHEMPEEDTNIDNSPIVLESLNGDDTSSQISELIQRFIQQNPGATERDYYDSEQYIYSFRSPEPVNDNTPHQSPNEELVEYNDEHITEEERENRIESFRRLISEDNSSDSDSNSDSNSDSESDSCSNMSIDSDGINITV